MSRSILGPWYAVEVALRTHPKTIDLSDRLGWSRNRATGAILEVWRWTFLHRVNGRLRKTDVRALERFLGYEGAPGSFVDALLACRLLVKSGRGYLVKGWDGRNGSHIQAARRRAQRERAALKVAGVSVQLEAPPTKRTPIGPWFALEVSAATDGRTLRLARELGTDRHSALGMVSGLYGYLVLSNPERGTLEEIDLDAVALELDFDGDPEVLLGALIRSGFDVRGSKPDPEGRSNDLLIVPDWCARNGSHMHAIRKRKQRQAQSDAVVVRQSRDSRETVAATDRQTNKQTKGVERTSTLCPATNEGDRAPSSRDLATTEVRTFDPDAVAKARALRLSHADGVPWEAALRQVSATQMAACA